MAERWTEMTDEDLGRALLDLGKRIDFPDTPDLVTSVATRLRTEEPRRWTRPSAPRWNRIGIAAASVLLVAGLLVFSPATRQAVADWLGVGGIRIITQGEPPSELGGDLVLGEPVTMGAARGAVGFPVRVTERAPDEVYLDDSLPGGLVSFVYAAGDGLPPLLGGEVGVLLSQFRATVGDVYAKKVVDTKVRVEFVTVDGVRGYWLSGEHFLMFEDAAGEPHSVEARLAGKTLLWEKDGITYRLESDLTLREALAFANSLS